MYESGFNVSDSNVLLSIDVLTAAAPDDYSAVISASKIEGQVP